MTKDKKNKPLKEIPLGFVDRQEKELLVRDFIISNIKEVMIKYGFQYLETPSFEFTDSIGKFLPDKEKDVFVHSSAVREAGLKYLNEGDELTFEVESTEKGPAAVKLQKTS